jgi:hypothetical protein
MSNVTNVDDSFHPAVSDDPFWTETSWYAFAIPERRMAGTIYPLFRPNLGVCSVAVYLWDDRSESPWAVPYGRFLWHVPMPDSDLTDISVAGLSYSCEEPLKRYRVRYEDPPLLEMDLVYEGLIPPHGSGIADGRGHFDQPCKVTGLVNLHGEQLRVDCLEMRDRSWHVREDTRTVRASYSYGIASASDSFLAIGRCSGEECPIVAGYLMMEGEKADLVSGRRRVLERHSGWPARVAVEVEDRLGRRMETEGQCLNRLANQATPGMFAWMSLTEWEFGSGGTYGEDQDIWSPDLLGSRG